VGLEGEGEGEGVGSGIGVFIALATKLDLSPFPRPRLQCAVDEIGPIPFSAPPVSCSVSCSGCTSPQLYAGAVTLAPAARRAMTATRLYGSTGFGSWTWNPAIVALSRSSG